MGYFALLSTCNRTALHLHFLIFLKNTHGFKRVTFSGSEESYNASKGDPVAIPLQP